MMERGLAFGRYWINCLVFAIIGLYSTNYPARLKHAAACKGDGFFHNIFQWQNPVKEKSLRLHLPKQGEPKAHGNSPVKVHQKNPENWLHITIYDPGRYYTKATWVDKQLLAAKEGSRMKRDMELVRKILLCMNDNEHGYAPQNLDISGYTEEQIGYHCLLLGEAGLIEASETSTLNAPSPSALPIRLTWEGHEFIENAQNEKIWGQTKEAIGKLGDVSFSVWASVLSQVVLRNLGMGS